MRVASDGNFGFLEHVGETRFHVPKFTLFVTPGRTARCKSSPFRATGVPKTSEFTLCMKVPEFAIDWKKRRAQREPAADGRPPQRVFQIVRERAAVQLDREMLDTRQGGIAHGGFETDYLYSICCRAVGGRIQQHFLATSAAEYALLVRVEAIDPGCALARRHVDVAIDELGGHAFRNPCDETQLGTSEWRLGFAGHSA
jgi:hypothetical protein